MDQSPRLQFLFDRYLSGTCSPEEVEELVALLHRDGADQYLDQRLQALWEHTDLDPDSIRVDWDRMLAEIRRSDEELVRLNQKPGRRWWWMAAAAVILTGAGAWWMTQKPRPLPMTAARVEHAPAVHTIHLPDGSTVVLNKGSRLDYPTAFTGKTREVYLSGEGYFDIRAVTGQPFLVHAGGLTTRVLGTTFDIKIYPGDGAVDVTVTRGRVQVLSAHRSLGTLGANQQIHYVPGSEAVRQVTVDPKPLVAWKPSEIFYDNITMDSAASTLEQRFGVAVTFVHSALKGCRVTATFSTDDGLEEILTVL